MFSKTASYTSKLIDCSFIAGIPLAKIEGESDVEPPSPECLLCFPESQRSSVNEGIIDLIFPAGIKYSYIDQSPKFNSITLTNEKGTRSYIYILKIFENVELEKLQKSELRVPLAICIRSMICDTEAFRSLLQEAYTIINYNPIDDTDNTPSDKELTSYKKIELLNFFMFINSLLIPPSHTLMTLNLRFSKVDFYFSSQYEIPCTLNDSNIKILFSCLEISMIIKLWFSILTEKRIIIIANQSFLLYSICEALLKLIFPFKWLHTYVPVLPTARLDYLEAPIPYIMGVLSSSADFATLEESYPETVICDVDSCQISKNTAKCSYLPQNEETNLRKKLQLVKNPEIFEIEEIISRPGNRIVSEDVNPDFSFSENVQKIFFRVIRNCLEGYKKSYLKLENVNAKKKYSIEEEKLLDNISCEEYKKVWEKIIKTTAFENFILFNQHLDDSYTKIFNNIIKYAQNEDKIKHNKNAYRLEITLPQNNIRNLSDKVKSMGTEDRELEQVFNDYFSYLRPEIKEELPTTPSKQLSPLPTKGNLTGSNAQLKKNSLMSSPLPQFSLATTGDSRFGYSKGNKTFTCDYRIGGSPLRRNNGTAEGFLTLLKREMTSQYFAFYNSDKNKGFISFAANVVKHIEANGQKIIDISIKQNLLKEIYSDFCESKILNRKETKKDDNPIPIMTEQITEATEENENEEFELRVSRSKSLRSTLKFHRTSEANIRSALNIDEKEEKYINIGANLTKSFQYYLFLAFYFEEMLASDSFIDALKLEKEAILDMILNYYQKAFTIDKKEFPVFRYSQHLDSLDLKRLNKIKMSSIGEMLKPLIQPKVQRLTRKLTSKSISISRNENGGITNSIRSFANTPKDILTSFASNSHIIDYSKGSTSPTSDDMKNTNSLSLFKHSISPKMNTTISFGDKSPLTFLNRISISPTCSENNNVRYLVAMKNQMKEEIKKKKMELKTPSPSDPKVTRIFDSNSKAVGFSLSETHEEISMKKVARDTIANCTSTAFHLDYQPLKEKKSSTWYSKKSFEEISEDPITKPAVLNLFMKVNKKFDPVQLINEIGSKMMGLMSTYHLTSGNLEWAFNEILATREMEKVKEAVACLQKVNIAKFSTREEKLSFWLNAFNFLLLFAMISKRRKLNTGKDWNLFLRNSLFNIGGYEISLYEMENRIIGGKNLHEEEISFPNELLKKFVISKSEDSFLVNFGISLPTCSFPNLKLYNSEKLYDMLTENAKQFLSSQIYINADMSTLHVSEYLMLVDPNFLVKGYLDHKNLLSDKLFTCLNNNKYESVDIIKISWIANSQM